ncbi:ATP-binding protein [Streptosporangium sandarakinum]|uniref:ATP-binding protein n=1 Tax=Streptosporangium sandarakinum TaxID=1260955 RepID=UPI0034235B21
MTGHPTRPAPSLRSETGGWERWLSILGRILPPGGPPPWSGAEVPAGQLRLAARGLSHDRWAARTAREFAAAALVSWELEPLVDDASVVVSELVTNAVRHGLRGDARARPFHDVRVVVCHTERAVLCAVTDPRDEGPRLREPDHEAESGRGLQVVQGICETWGWAPLETSGKAVWASFALPGRTARRLEACR